MVVGLGKSGIASAEVLCARGTTVYVTDEKPREALAEAIATSDRLGATFIDPLDIASVVASLRCAVLTPGIPLTSPVVRAFWNVIEAGA